MSGKARARRGHLVKAPRGLAFVAVATLALGLALFGSTVPDPATAAPGTPGVPQANTPVFAESFENVTGTSPVLLTNYTGALGEKYTADARWLVACNGLIVNYNIPYTTMGNCGLQSSSASLRQLAYALGVHDGQADPSSNDAVAALTEGNGPGAGRVQFATVSNIPLASSSGRFLTFSVDTAALACNVSAPQYQFSFVDQTGTATPIGGVLNACSSGETVAVPAVGPYGATNASVGTYTSDGSVLFSGSTVGIRMTNANGSGKGNDAAFDNIRILDVTPQLDKSFSPSMVLTGGTSTLTFTITNTEELAVKNGWSFTDTLPAGLVLGNPVASSTDCPAGSVTAVNGGTSISVNGNLSAGMASCTVTVSVTSSTPGTYTNGPGNVTQTGLNPPGPASVTFIQAGINLVKSAGNPTDVNGNGITDAGDTIAYTFTVENTGNSALSNITVNDPKAGAVSCPSTTLAVGGSQICNADALYTVTSADVAAGSVDNTATATGTPPVGPPVTSSPSSTSTPTQAPAPALSLVKSANPSTSAEYNEGQIITYSFVVANTGNVPIEGITIDEVEFSGAGTLSAIDCATTTLAVDASTTCTATYELTQEDVDAGELTNTATATGTPVGGDETVTTAPSNVVIPSDPAPAVSLVKSVNPESVDAAGDEVLYSFRVTNTGNVTLTDPTIDETAFSGTGGAPEVACPTGISLLPGQWATCTAAYTVTQADVDAGSIVNTATASATPPGTAAAPVSEPSSATVSIAPSPSLTLEKSSELNGTASAGETLTYSFSVTNTGNVALSDIAVTETQFSGAGTLGPITCPATTLTPNNSTTCTAPYTLTQEDVDAGEVTNTAVATGAAANGDPVTSSPSSDLQPLDAAPALSLVKSADPDDNLSAGEAITFSFVLTNTGNVTLTDVAAEEGEFTGTGDLPQPTCPAEAASVAPGDQVVCTAVYTVTQQDADAGEIANTATGIGTPPGTQLPVRSAPSTVTLPAAPAPPVPAAPAQTLPATGADIGWAAGASVVAALAALAAGAVMLTTRRRTRPEQ